MQFWKAEHTSPQVVISEQRRQSLPNCADQAAVNTFGNRIREQCGLQGRRIMARARTEYVALNRVGESSGECVPMILKLSIKLMEGAFTQFRVWFIQERTERTLSQCSF